MKQADLTRELRLSIKAHLQQCDPEATPNICREIGTLGGYRRIESMIITIVSREGISVGAAIAHLDSEL